MTSTTAPATSSSWMRITVVHDQLERSPKTASSVSADGWMHVLSGIETLLETGKPIFG
jgi:hypothetical protein